MDHATDGILMTPAFSRSIQQLHACVTRESISAWLARPVLPVLAQTEVIWGCLKRRERVWRADWLQDPEINFALGLMSDSARLERVIRFAAAGGGFSLVMLPAATGGLTGPTTPGLPTTGVAWIEDGAGDRGCLFGIHDPKGLGRDARKVISLVLPHLYWVTRSMLVRERRLRRESASVSLTKREQELLKEVVRGRADREIAERSGRSQHTIKNQVRSILRKLGVSRRTQAAFVAERNQLIDTHIDLNSRWNTRFEI